MEVVTNTANKFADIQSDNIKNMTTLKMKIYIKSTFFF